LTRHADSAVWLLFSLSQFYRAIDIPVNININVFSPKVNIFQC